MGRVAVTRSKWMRRAAALPNPERPATSSIDELGRLQQAAGVLDAVSEQPLLGRAPGLGDEVPGEAACAHLRVAGEVADGHGLGEVLEGPGASVGEAVAVARIGHRRGR